MSCTDKKVTAEPQPVVASYGIDQQNIVTLGSEFGLRVNPINTIYWNSNSNIYFKTININSYDNILNNFDVVQSTQHFYFKDQINHENLLYLGTISSNQLVYLDCENKQTNVLTIEEIDDTFIEYWGGGAGRSDKTVSNTHIFYPYRSGTYTNTSDSVQWWRGGSELRLTPIDPDDYQSKLRWI